MSTSRQLPEIDGHQSICPSVLDYWSEAWILVFWPLVVIPCGILVGYCVARISGAPKRHRNAILLSTGFANSGSLPATLLAVLSHHHDGGSTSKEGDTASPSLGPNAFLSLYLILAPMLLWSLGYWLAHPSEDYGHESMEGHQEEIEGQNSSMGYGSIQSSQNTIEAKTESKKDNGLAQDSFSSKGFPVESCCPSSLVNVMQKLFQPPVIGAGIGLIVVLFEPLRQSLVGSNASLAWFFGGLTLLGQSSIPLSMGVLGMSLSSSIKHSRSRDNTVETFSIQTIAGIITGKMILMPAIGHVSFWFLRDILNIRFPPSMALVLMIQWCTPTANNVAVMCDLAGGLQEAVAQLMLWEYAFAPILLSISMSFVVTLSKFDV